MLAALRPHQSRRRTGIGSAGDTTWGTHFCQFYRTADDLTDVLVPFFVAGLEQNERCVWITAEPLRATEAREAMRKALAGFDDYEARGQIEILDHDAWYTRTGALDASDVLREWFEREAAALRDGFEGLRVSGNTSWLNHGAWDAFVEYEAQVHACFQERKILALCSYAIEQCEAPQLMDVLRNHGWALLRDRGKWTVIRSVTELITELNTERAHGVPPAHDACTAEQAQPRGDVCAGHDVRFYVEGEFPADDVASYLHASVARGGAAIAVATRAHLVELRAALATSGIDVAAALQSGQLGLLEAEAYIASLTLDTTLSRTSFEARVPAAVRAALARFPSLRVFGEGVDVLCQSGRFTDAVQLESWWNELRAELRFDLLCGYSLAHFRAASAADHLASVSTQHMATHLSGSVELDALLASHFQQRSRALEHEMQRNQRLEVERAALARAQAETLEHVEAARQHLTKLQRVTAALAESLTLEDVRSTLEAEVLEVMGASACGLLVLDGGDGARKSFGSESNADLCRSACEASIVCRGQDGSEVHGWAPTHEPIEAMGLSLHLGQRKLGAIAIELTPPRPLDVTQRALLQDFARQLAFAVDRAVLYERESLARERAEASSRAKDEFLAMLGHELRNPLAPMLTALQLLRIRHPEAGAKERAVIERQLHHMVRLVDDLLEVSRIRRGSFELVRERVELADVVSKAIEMASPLLEARQHRLDVDVPQRGLVLDADPGRLSQVFSNLLTNAAKFTPAGGAISVWATRDADRVRVHVHDDGTGIDTGLLPRIFDMFVQGPQGLDRAHGGLGIGLWLARTLVELHGGVVRAESEGPDRGSTFVVELPVLPAASAEVSAPSSRTMQALRHDAKPLRILVVDDNVDAAESLADWLADDGHETRIASDGPDALRVAAELRPHLAFVDIGLPVMDGYELAQQLAAQLQDDLPVLVAVTGYGQRSDVERALAAGFAEHVVKPPKAERLQAIVERVVEASYDGAPARSASRAG